MDAPSAVMGRGTLVIAVITFCLAILRGSVGDPTIVPWIFGAAGVAFLFVALLHYVRAPTWLPGALLPLTGWAATFAAASVEGGLQSDAVLWMPFVPFVATLTLGARGTLVFAPLTLFAPIVLWLSLDNSSDPAIVLRTGAVLGAIAFAGILGVMYEHNRTRRLAEVRRNHEYLQVLVGNVSDGIAVTDDQGVLVVVNQRLLDIFEISQTPAEAAGQNTWRVLNSASARPINLEQFRRRVVELSTTSKTTATDMVEFADGRYFERTFVPIQIDDLRFGHVWSYHDVTTLHSEHSAALELLATDDLTLVSSRSDLLGQLEELCSSDMTFALLFLDLDGFKAVNDTLGHAAGDHVLRTVAQRMTAVLRAEDEVGRFGGDEFGVICPGIRDDEAVAAVCAKVLCAVNQSISFEGESVRVGASIGALRTRGGEPEQLLRAADSAMYLAKRAGKNCYRLAASPPPAEAAASAS